MKFKIAWDLLILVLIAVLVLAFCHPTKADVPGATYELTLGIYSAAKGHTVQWRSYRDVIRVPGYTDYDTCAAAADYAQQHFYAKQEAITLSQDLLDAVCTQVRP